MEYTVKNLPLHDLLYDWSERKKHVDQSREIKGWHDLNGDGWSDYVEAPGPNPTGTRYYDDNTDNAVTDGFLTKKRQCIDLIYAAGESCGGSWADTLFIPGARGSLAKKVAATGVTHTYGYSFGYSIPTTTTVSSLAVPTTKYTTTDTLDYRLRVIESTAPSGVTTFTAYDFFDRPIEESIQGRAAGAPKTILRKHSYQDVSFPNWHRIEGMGMGGTDLYQDLDAMGKVVRNWTKSGSNFVRTDYLYDVRGLKIKSAYPVSGQPSHNSSAPFAFDQVLDMHYYDGFGNEREAYTDYSAGVGHAYYPKTYAASDHQAS